MFREIHSRPHWQNTAYGFRKLLFQVEQQEAQGAKVHAKIQYELEEEKCSKFFFQEMQKSKDTGNDALYKKTWKTQTESLRGLKLFPKSVL